MAFQIKDFNLAIPDNFVLKQKAHAGRAYEVIRNRAAYAADLGDEIPPHLSIVPYGGPFSDPGFRTVLASARSARRAYFRGRLQLLFVPPGCMQSRFRNPRHLTDKRRVGVAPTKICTDSRKPNTYIGNEQVDWIVPPVQ